MLAKSQGRHYFTSVCWIERHSGAVVSTGATQQEGSGSNLPAGLGQSVWSLHVLHLHAWFSLGLNETLKRLLSLSKTLREIQTNQSRPPITQFQGHQCCQDNFVGKQKITILYHRIMKCKDVWYFHLPRSAPLSCISVFSVLYSLSCELNVLYPVWNQVHL